MKHLRLLMILTACTIMLSCDPAYNVEFIIENQTDRNIEILSTNIFNNSPDTNRISTGTKLVLLQESGIGSTSAAYLDALTSMPYSNIEIIPDNGTTYTKDGLDINNWDKINPEYNGASGLVLLTLRSEDFE